MGSSLGCVKQPRDVGPGGTRPASPKRKLRFRRKRKVKTAQKKAEAEREEVVSRFELKEEAIASTTNDASAKLSSQTITETPTQVILVPGAAPILGSTGTLRGSRVAILSPDPSPAWVGALHKTSGEGVSEEPQAEAAHSTPGGGRVCRVRERVQGVVERPCLLRAEKEQLEVEEMEDEGGQSELLVDELLEMEHKGVVHIREAGGRLCVVRTVYPKDYGSPVWHDKGLELHTQPLAASPIIGDIQKVQVHEGERKSSLSTGATKPAVPVGPAGKEFLLGNLAQERECPGPLQDPQSSGYASDMPLTSPETGGAVHTDWGSSSDVLNSSVLESPISPPEKPSQPLSQVRNLNVFVREIEERRYLSNSLCLVTIICLLQPSSILVIITSR